MRIHHTYTIQFIRLDHNRKMRLTTSVITLKVNLGDNRGMNQIIVTSFLSMLLALSVASCGKKAQESKSENPINVSNPVDSNLEVETHKELQKAIIENDLAKLEDLLTKKNLVDLS